MPDPCDAFISGVTVHDGDYSSVTEIGKAIARLTARAAEALGEREALGHVPPLRLAEVFEQLANDQLDIVSLISARQCNRHFKEIFDRSEGDEPVRCRK